MQLNFDNVPEFSVSSLANNVKKTLEGAFGRIKLRGEISGYRGPHSSGHCYFALKDDKARVDAVVWRGVFSKLQFKPEEGMEVIATGKISSYPGSSKYQIVIDALEPAGVGALMALLEERKKKLAAEGLFDENRKSEFPFLPKTIGIVTSPTGAVIQDMMHGFSERFPAHVIVWPVRVQGETCAKEVAHAVRGFNALNENDLISKPDVLIVARGGGSLEDLWGFNEEIVARAVAESEIPVISAVGHETDWTIIDLVADARAPTPTKAAEWAVPKYSELVERIAELQLRLGQTARRNLENKRVKFTSFIRGLPRLQDLIGMPRQRFDACAERLSPALRANIQSKRALYLSIQGRFMPLLGKLLGKRMLNYQRVASRLNSSTIQHKILQFSQRLDNNYLRLSRAISTSLTNFRSKVETQQKLLNSLGYHNVLQRGFAIIRDEKKQMVRSVQAVHLGNRLDIELSDGHIFSQVVGQGEEPHLNVQDEAPKSTRKKDKKRSDQGSLF